ncbi:MAG: RDD family protein [Thaumarchaeota archaeon]|nr:RDD family protein [Nitrososphaerota archaeon]
MSGFDALMKESQAQTYWVKRLVAYIVDVVIVYVVLAILASIVAFQLLLLSGPGAFGAVLVGAFSVVSGVLLFLYFFVTEVSMGSSIGKRVFGLKVVADNGGKPSGSQAALRNISKIFWVLLLLDVILGLAMSKQYTMKYSDTFAHTSVVAA